jgi:hypothetical protein
MNPSSKDQLIEASVLPKTTDLDDNFQFKKVIDDIIDKIILKIEFETKVNYLYPKDVEEKEEPILPCYHGSFNASEIAALIGKNPNITKTQALYNLLIKNHKFKNAIDRLNVKLNLNKNKEIINKSIKKLCTDINRIANNATKLIVNDLDDLKIHIKSDIKIAMKNLDAINDKKLIDKIEAEMQSEIYKKRGVNLEAQALNEHEIDKNIQITRRNDKLYEYKSKNKLYKIYGRIDGFNDIENCIIEIKNRINRKEFIPSYDYIQCLIYMQLTSYKKCYLIECYADKSKKQTLIEWEKSCLKEIHDKLSELVIFIRKLTNKDVNDLVVRYSQEYLELNCV